MKGLQEQLAQIQPELMRLRTELQEKSGQVDQLKQQNTEKDEKTKKAILVAKQRISLLNSECSTLSKYPSCENVTSIYTFELSVRFFFFLVFFLDRMMLLSKLYFPIRDHPKRISLI